MPETMRPRDWLDDILDARDTDQPESGQDAEQVEPPSARDRRRIQPWWTGRHVDLAKPDEDHAEPTGEEGPEEEPAEDADDDPDSETSDDEPKQPARWDPVAVADRIVHAYQQRPAGERLKHAAHVVVDSRARWGQLLYTASGVWAAWRIGFTPWLLHETASAPIGIPVFVLGLGWLVNRRLDGTPLLIAWCGRAVYTATVINLVLHP